MGSSSTVEHPAVNRTVAGSSPAFPAYCSNMAENTRLESIKMNLHENMSSEIKKQINDTESFRQELRNLYEKLSALHCAIVDVKRNAEKQNWPRICMECVCKEAFFESKRSRCGEFNIDYDVEVGETFLFVYDYEEGVFREDSNFNDDFSIFTYEKFSNNFTVVKYWIDIERVSG